MDLSEILMSNNYQPDKDWSLKERKKKKERKKERKKESFMDTSNHTISTKNVIFILKSMPLVLNRPKTRDLTMVIYKSHTKLCDRIFPFSPSSTLFFCSYNAFQPAGTNGGQLFIGAEAQLWILLGQLKKKQVVL